MGYDRAFELFTDVLAPACISSDHPRYLAFVPTAPSEAATLFDLVVSASSIYGDWWLEGAGAIHAENETLRWMGRLAGLPDARARECGAEPFTPDAPELEHFESFYKNCKPQCGRFKQEQLAYLFGDQAPAVGSAAVIPLGANGGIGLLAIGSQEANRFHPGMGTLFLGCVAKSPGGLARRHR